MNVERVIPPELIHGLGTKYTVSGGTIRIAPGYENAGTIVKHLRFPENAEQTNKILQELKSTIENQKISSQDLQNYGGTLEAIKSLQNATLILQGVNLAISAVGFALVLTKLNEIEKQLEKIDAKLDRLQLTANEIKTYQEITQHSKYFANLENLRSGLNINKESMIYGAISNIRESQFLFQRVCTNQLQDTKSLYQDSELFFISFQVVIGSAICIANAHAQRDEYDEASRALSGLSEWISEITPIIFNPIKSKPVWLGKLDPYQVEKTKKLINLNRSLPESINYLNNFNLLKIPNSSLRSINDKNSLLVIDI